MRTVAAGLEQVPVVRCSLAGSIFCSTFFSTGDKNDRLLTALAIQVFGHCLLLPKNPIGGDVFDVRDSTFH